jgi:hypothetical protein
MKILSHSDGLRQVPIGEIVRARRSRRTQIEEFFLEHLGERFDTNLLHQRFGTSFRARASDINRNPAAPIQIFNKTSVGRDTLGQACERSVYWAELRTIKPAEQLSISDFMKRRQAEEAMTCPLFANGGQS